MSSDSSSDAISPALRARLQKCFEYGNQKMQIGDYDYATEMFIQCVLGDPTNIIYMQSYIANLRVKYGNNKKGASFGFLKGSGSKGAIKTAEMRKKWDDVLKAGYESLKTNPWDTSTFISMGRAAIELDYAETGLAFYKHAVESSPNDPEVNRIAARELGVQGLFPDAIACWQRVLKEKPDDIEAGRQITDLMLEQTINRVREKPEKDKEAELQKEKLSVEDDCEKRLKKNPLDRDVYIELADYFFKNGKFRKVEDVYRRALKIFENDPLFSLQLVETQKIRISEDLRQTKRLYEQSPSEELKEKYIQQKQEFDQKSLTLIKAKLERNPDNSVIHYEYGSYLLSHKMFKEAISEFQIAKADLSLLGDCLLALAQCFQEIKQYKLAMTHYEQAINELPKDGESIKKALYSATRLSAFLKEYKKADDYANQLAAIDFSYKDIGDLLDKIAKLRHND